MIQRLIDILTQMFYRDEPMDQMSDKWIRTNLYNMGKGNVSL